jgi:integrase
MAREHIYLRADEKAYVVQFRQNDNPDHPRVFRTFNFEKYGSAKAAKAEAKLFEAREMAKQERGQTTHRSPKVTFKEAGERWLAHGKAKGWRKSTACDYESCCRRLNKPFGHLLLVKLTEQNIEAWLEKARKEISERTGKEISERTVRKLMFVGGAVCERAHRIWPGYTDNPFRAVEAGETEQTEHPWFEDEEVLAIVRAAETEQMKAIILTAWRAGLRLGEIPPLRVKDDLVLGAKPHIIVNRSYVLGIVNDTPKGKRPRHVPLEVPELDGDVAVLPDALDKLLKARKPEPVRGDLVFQAEDGGLLSPDGISYRFRKARDRAGVRNLGFHTLRHTFCTRLAQEGVHVTKIQAWAGHASITTTQTYMHHAPSDDDGKLISAAFRPERIEQTHDEPDLDERKVGELTDEELAEIWAARIQARRSA